MCRLTALVLVVWIGTSEGICPTPDASCPSSYIKFYLSNRNGFKIPVDDSATGVQSAPFSDAPLIVLIHGTNGSKDDSPNTELIPEYMKAGSFNILSVDYSPLVPLLCFPLRMRSTVPVGTCLARMLNLIYDALPNKFLPQKTHILGFSLGAHIAGIAGNLLKPSRLLGRITGLDPGGTGYQGPTGLIVPAEERLDVSHASFVDVVHTDSIGLGLFSPLGHVDFYLNKGYAQPNCLVFSPIVQFTSLLSPVSDLASGLLCSHMRAPKYYAESINSQVKFYGEKCTVTPSSAIFLGDICVPSDTHSRVEMGEYTSPETRGTYKVTTNTSPPWARM